METSAAMLKQPLMAAAMSNMGAGGTFGLNSGNVRALASGQLDITQMAHMGANNMMSAVQKDGVGALGAFQMQQGELQDQLGRVLSPVGIQMMKMQQVQRTQKMLGVSGAGGMFAAAKAMGMDDDAAKQMVSEANSPEYFQNLQRQVQVARQESRAMAREQRIATSPTIGAQFAQSSSTIRRMRGDLTNIGEGFGDFTEGVGSFFGQMGEESAARKSGQTMMRTHSNLLSSSPLESRMINQMSVSDMRRAGLYGVGAERSTAILRTPSGRALGHSEGLANFKDAVFGGDGFDLAQMREAQGGLRGMLGGGNLETAARWTSLNLGGTFATGDEVRATNKKFAAGSALMMSGLSAGTDVQKAARGRIAKKLGSGGEAKANQLTTAFENKLAAIARSKATLGGNAALDSDDYEQALAQAAKEIGVDPSAVSVSDVATAGTKGAMSLAGAQGEGSFRMIDFVGKGGIQGTRDNLMKIQKDAGKALMGTKGGGLLASFGDDARQHAAMDMLFTQDIDPRVGQLAALDAAAQTGDPKAMKRRDEMVNKLRGEKGGDEIIARAQNTLKNAGKNADMFARTGETLAGTGSLGDMDQLFLENRDKFVGAKAGNQILKGLESVVKDKSLLAAGSDPEKILQAAAAKGGEGLSGAAKKLAIEFGNTNDPKKRAALAQKFQDLTLSAGYSAESETAGGEKNAAADTQATMQSDMITQTGVESASNFPRSIQTFYTASMALQKAASDLSAISIPRPE